MSDQSSVAEFYIDENVLARFQRCNRNNVDCAVNVFELLQVLNSQDSGSLRERINNIGMFDDMFLSYLYYKAKEMGHNYNFSYESINPYQIINYSQNYLSPNKAIIIRYKIPNYHVFIIAKDKYNKTFIIDPQVNNVFCPLDLQACNDYILISGRSDWEIIKTQPYLPPVLDVSDIDMDVEFGFSSIKKRRSRKKSKNILRKSRKNSRQKYSFGVLGNIKQKAMSVGKTAFEQAKKYGSGVASDLKNEAKTQATSLKEQAQSQATSLKEQAQSQATSLKEQAQSQAIQQIQQL
jgi:hypothetical protein